MYLKQLFAFITASILFISCDDNTSTLGMEMVPASDLITKTYKAYDVKTSSFAVGDSVLSRTSTFYFGQYTDPITNSTVKSDFLSQFNYPFYGIDENISNDTVLNSYVTLYVDEFVGDSLAPLHLEVYELDSLLDPNTDFYTNIDPSKFIKEGAKPIGSTVFTASNRTITDSARYANRNNALRISIPIDKEVGKNILEGFKKDPTLAEQSKWLKSGLRGSKGFYFKLCGGDGAMLYFSSSLFSVVYKYHNTVTDQDSTSALLFEGSEEVIQASRFTTSNIQELVKDESCTYLKCPAGIFTLAELPIDSISINDTINSASIKFTRYNDDAETSNKVDSEYRLGMPKNVLMVRYDDYVNGFFESYKLADNTTSYIAKFSEKANSYEFSNISRLISTMLQEKKNGTASENYNKVLIIPITTNASSTTESVSKIGHDFSMKSARLVGGKDGGVKIELVYSRFMR